MSDDNDNPFEKLETVKSHHETADEHTRRAQNLEAEAVDNILSTMEESLGLPDGGNCTHTQHGETTGILEWSAGQNASADDVFSGDLGEEFPGYHLEVVSVTLRYRDQDSWEQAKQFENMKQLIGDLEERHDDGAPLEVVLSSAHLVNLDRTEAEHEIEKLKQKGEVYEPSTDHLRTT